MCTKIAEGRRGLHLLRSPEDIAMKRLFAADEHFMNTLWGLIRKLDHSEGRRSPAADSKNDGGDPSEENERSNRREL